MQVKAYVMDSKTFSMITAGFFMIGGFFGVGVVALTELISNKIDERKRRKELEGWQEELNAMKEKVENDEQV